MTTKITNQSDIRIKGCAHVDFFKEGNMFVAYCSAVDLCTCGKTYDEARRNFTEAFTIFWEECMKHRTALEVATGLGWRVAEKNGVFWLSPPHYLGAEPLQLAELAKS